MAESSTLESVLSMFSTTVMDCGAPAPVVRMSISVVEVTRPLNIPTTVSLNPVMVDGTGMCGGCRVKIADGIKFACVDGPDFDAHCVDFDELLTRQRRFKVEELAAAADYEHRCQVEQTLFVEGKRTYKKLREIEPTKVPMPERDPGVRSRTFDEGGLRVLPL